MTARFDARIPLTVGVTGHRSLAEPDLPSYRRGVEAFFDELSARYPHTPLCVLSPLAEGADRLVVEVALARKHEVVAVLPLSARDYERDFDERAAAFRALLQLIPPDRIIELPAVSVSTGAASQRADRDAHYAQAGHYVASRCHVLLALWDGVANALPGGTGEVVQYKLTGRGPFPPAQAEASDVPGSGPVAWLKVRRDGSRDAEAGDAPVGTLRWLYPDDRAAASFDEVCRRLDALHATALQRPAIEGR